MTRIASILYALILIGFLSCQKSTAPDPDPVDPVTPPISNTNSIELLSSTALPGELVLAQANFRPAKDTATLTVGNTTALAIVLEGKQVVFIMPVLPASTTVTVDFINLGANKQLPISIGSYTAITEPEIVLTAYMAAQDKVVQNLEEYKNNSTRQLDPAYIELIKYTNQGITTKYAGLNSTDKLQLAYVLRQNMPLLTDTKMDALEPSFLAKMQESVPDAEDVSWATSFNVAAKAVKGLTLMATAGGIVAVAIQVAPGAILGAITGVALAITGAAYWVKGCSLLSSAIGDTKGMFASVSKAEDNISSQRLTGDEVSFTNGVEKEISFLASFRTVIQADTLSTNPLLEKIIAAYDVVKNAKAKMVATYSKIKQFITGAAPQPPADDLILKASPGRKTLLLQPEKLSIINVSNSSIHVTYRKEEKSLFIKATSSVTQQTPFSFDVVYTNPTTGTVVTTRINCVYNFVVYKLGNLDGTPLNTTPLVFGLPADGKFLILLNEDGTAATGIDYTKITVNNISTPNVTVDAIPTPPFSFLASVKSTQTTSQPFSFDVLYQSAKVGTVNATLYDSLEYYRAMIPGEWSNLWESDVSGTGSFTFVEENFLTLSPGGSARWHTIVDASGNTSTTSQEVGWGVFRSGNQYMMQLGQQTGRITPAFSFFTMVAAQARIHSRKL